MINDSIHHWLISKILNWKCFVINSKGRIHYHQNKWQSTASISIELLVFAWKSGIIVRYVTFQWSYIFQVHWNQWLSFLSLTYFCIPTITIIASKNKCHEVYFKEFFVCHCQGVKCNKKKFKHEQISQGHQNQSQIDIVVFIDFKAKWLNRF